MRFYWLLVTVLAFSASESVADERISPRVSADAAYRTDRGAQVSGSSVAPRANTMSGTIAMWIDPTDGSAELAVAIANDGILVARDARKKLSPEAVAEFRSYLGDAPAASEGSPRGASAEARTTETITETRSQALAPTDHVVFQFTYTYDPSTELAMVGYSRSSKADTTALTEAIYVPKSEFSPQSLWADYVAILKSRHDKAPVPPLYRELDGKWIAYFLAPVRAAKAGLAKTAVAGTWGYKGWTYYPNEKAWYRQVRKVVNGYYNDTWEKWDDKTGGAPPWERKN